MSVPPGGGGTVPPPTPPTSPTPEAENRAEQEAAANAQVGQIIAQSVEREKELNRIMEERLGLIGSTGEARLKLLEQEGDLLTKAVISIQKAGDGYKDNVENIKSIIKEMGTLSEARSKELQEAIESAETQQDQLDIIQKQLGVMEDIKNTQQEINNVTNSVASKFGLASKTSETLLGRTVLLGHQLKKMGGEQGAQGVALGLYSATQEAFGLEKILASIVEEAVKLTLELDKAAKSFGKATGFDTAGVNDQLLEASRSGVKAAVTLSDAGKSFEALASGMSSFKMGSVATNNSLIETVSLLDAFGISTNDSVKSLDFLVTALGRTEKQAENTTMAIATMGRSINVSGTKMISDFNSNAGKLIGFGSKMEQVFKNLAVQSKLTGIEMGTLISTAEKFDTFEGATKQVAQMNAVLGTNMSSMEMMNMSHDERIDRIRQEVKASVGNFNTLDRYTQMYIQNAMGVNSLEEASRLLNMSQSEYFDNQSKMQAAADTQEKLAEMAAEYVPLLEQMKLHFMEIVRTLDPLIKGFSATLELFAKSPAILYTLVGALAVGRIAMLMFGASAGFAQAQMGLIGLSIKLLMVAFALLVGEQSMTNIGLFIAGLILLYVAFRLLRKETDNTTFGFKLLAKVFAKKINPPMIAAFAFMAVGVVALALALRLVKGQVMLAAIAMALLAGAFALAFYGFAAMTGALNELIKTFIESVDVLPKVAVGMYLIAGAMLAMGMAAMVSASSMLMFLTGLAAIGAIVMIATGVTALGSLGESMDAIGSGMERFASGLAQVVSISKELSGLSENSFMAFSAKGSETSAIISSNDLIKTAVSGKIKVDVNIPEIKSPTVNLSVYLNGFKLDTSGDSDIARVVVGAS